jgi:hypothetical protein
LGTVLGSTLEMNSKTSEYKPLSSTNTFSHINKVTHSLFINLMAYENQNCNSASNTVTEIVEGTCRACLNAQGNHFE